MTGLRMTGLRGPGGGNMRGIGGRIPGRMPGCIPGYGMGGLIILGGIGRGIPRAAEGAAEAAAAVGV